MLNSDEQQAVLDAVNGILDACPITAKDVLDDIAVCGRVRKRGYALRDMWMHIGGSVIMPTGAADWGFSPTNKDD